MILVTTNRITLTRTEKTNWQEFHRLFCNMNVMRLFDSGIIFDENQTLNMVNQFHARWDNGDLLSPLVIRTHENQFIGLVNLRHKFCKQKGHVEIGYMIDESYWNKGYATEATQAALTYLQSLVAKQYQVKSDKLTTVVATAHPANPASLQILKKVEMQYVGEALRDGYPRAFFIKNLGLNKISQKFTPYELFSGVTAII